MTRRTPVLAAAAAATLAATLPSAPADGAQRLDVTSTVRMLPGGGATLVQEGTFAGRPLGRGKVRVRTQVGKGRGSVVRFTMRNSRGSITGTGDVAVTFKGSLILYQGTAKIISGTGKFRRMRASGLRVSGRGRVSGERFVVRLTGRV
jgi:hypothetical protein